MRFPASTISVLPRLDTSRWFGLLALPALFAALALAWISFSESLLRIAAPDPGVLPMLRMLNNLLFILLTTAFWTFWLVRQASAHRRRETLWRTLLEQAPIPLVLARKGKVVACNPAFSGLLGQTDSHALLDYPLLSRIPAEELVALLRQLKGVDPRHPRVPVREPEGVLSRPLHARGAEPHPLAPVDGVGAERHHRADAAVGLVHQRAQHRRRGGAVRALEVAVLEHGDRCGRVAVDVVVGPDGEGVAHAGARRPAGCTVFPAHDEGPDSEESGPSWW